MFKRMFSEPEETSQLDVVVHVVAAFVAIYKAGTKYVEYKSK